MSNLLSILATILLLCKADGHLVHLLPGGASIIDNGGDLGPHNVHNGFNSHRKGCLSEMEGLVQDVADVPVKGVTW